MGNARWTSALSEIEDRWVSGMAKQQKPGRTLGGDFDYLEKWGFFISRTKLDITRHPWRGFWLFRKKNICLFKEQNWTLLSVFDYLSETWSLVNALDVHFIFILVRFFARGIYTEGNSCVLMSTRCCVRKTIVILTSLTSHFYTICYYIYIMCHTPSQPFTYKYLFVHNTQVCNTLSYVCRTN